jgi:hypothetical protein
MAGNLNSSTMVPPGWRVWLPAIVLFGVAIAQIVLAKTVDLSPWKGGGFGMFATIDGTAFRHMRIIVDAPGRSEELDIAPSQEIISARSALFPSELFLLKTAKAVTAREKRYGRPVSSVTIQVWRADFNEHLEGTDRRLRTFTWHVDEQPVKSR